MDTISYSNFRSHLANTLDKVNDDHVPIMITRQNGKPAVLISLEDFKSYEDRLPYGKPQKCRAFKPGDRRN
jgi:antitoxin YefM